MIIEAPSGDADRLWHARSQVPQSFLSHGFTTEGALGMSRCAILVANKDITIYFHEQEYMREGIVTRWGGSSQGGIVIRFEVSILNCFII